MRRISRVWEGLWISGAVGVTVDFHESEIIWTTHLFCTDYWT